MAMEQELFSLHMECHRTMVEDFIATQCVAADEPYARLLDAMRYSLTAGGKRLRPILTLEFCRLCGGDIEAALPAACGVELLHTYSLIHDDLPCMDDDDLRRGRPSNHRVFGEATAVLAGDALQALAFETVLSAPLAPERALRCAQILTHAAGHAGICGGQQLDLAWEGKKLDRDELLEIHLRKTSALIRAACLMGVTAAGGTAAQEDAARRYADSLGLAFQIRDDMLDIIGDEATFGKPIGSDKTEEKTTFVDLLGLDGCAHEVTRLTDEAVSALGIFGSEADFLTTLSRGMETRNS